MSQELKFEKGQKVKHRSSEYAPEMIVIGTGDQESSKMVTCSWWDFNSKGFHNQEFYVIELETRI